MFLHSLLFSFWVPVWTWDVSHSLNTFNNYLLTKFPSLIISIFVICFLNLCFLQEKYQEASNYWIQLYDMENCRQILHRLSSKMKVCCLWRFTKRIYIYIYVLLVEGRKMLKVIQSNLIPWSKIVIFTSFSFEILRTEGTLIPLKPSFDWRKVEGKYDKRKIRGKKRKKRNKNEGKGKKKKIKPIDFFFFTFFEIHFLTFHFYIKKNIEF